MIACLHSIKCFYLCSQLIYDFKDGGASIGLISLNPSDIKDEDKEKFEKIGIKIPSKM